MRWLPTKPAPPVTTRVCMSVSAWLGVDAVEVDGGGVVAAFVPRPAETRWVAVFRVTHLPDELRGPGLLQQREGAGPVAKVERGDGPCGAVGQDGDASDLVELELAGV